MPPGNDNFANATNIDPATAGSVAGTTFDATKETGEESINTNDQSVWYRVVPTATGWYRFWVQPSDFVAHPERGIIMMISDQTTLATLTRANSYAFTYHPTSASLGGNQTLAMKLNASQTYYLRIHSIATSATLNLQTCDFTLRWAPFTPPANDDFANAITLGTLPDTKTVSILDATIEAGEPLLGSGGGTVSHEQGVWYKYVAPATGWVEVKFVKSSLTYVGGGIVGLVDGIDQNPGNINFAVAQVTTLANFTTANVIRSGLMGMATAADQKLYFQATSGLTYYIKAYYTIRQKEATYSNSSDLNCFNAQAVQVSMVTANVVPPANDDFANAQTLSPPAGGTLSATTLNATEEATEPTTHGSASDIQQSIWYKITPTTTGTYRFIVPYTSIVYAGIETLSWGNLQISLFNSSCVSLATATTANAFASDQGFPPGPSNSNWNNYRTVVVYASLTSGTTYFIKISSSAAFFNRPVCNFDLVWELLPVTTNDNFASPIAISGASGTQDFTSAGSTFDTAGGEPPSLYWNAPQTTGTNWFDWTCPATGDYVFFVGANETGRYFGNADLAVYTGSAINALTRLGSFYSGTQDTGINDRYPKTGVGFHATSGVHYKIQVSANFTSAFNHRLTWRANTVTGDSTATAVPFSSGRQDNYGNDASEPPPNLHTLLDAHSDWTPTMEPGHVKWYKQTYETAQTVTISARQWDGLASYTGTVDSYDMGLIVYKGADYASLTVAQTTGALSAAAVLNPSSNPSDQITGEKKGWFTLTSSESTSKLAINVAAGETLWICVFGAYYTEYAGYSAEQATQGDFDLHIVTPAPANDVRTALNSAPLVFYYPWYLSQTEWVASPGSSWWTKREAGQASGTTMAATSDVGEGSHGGYGPTRSVWYVLDIAKAGSYKIWVESTVDCVLGIYNKPNGTLGTLIAEDDDSGAGNWPEITTTLGLGDYWVVVDSKAEGSFTLKWQKQAVGTPPTNDNFANATVISSIPFSTSGTTVNATAEPGEHDATVLGFGPSDSVWYKYVATFNGQIKIRATCNTAINDAFVYVDMWRGTTLETLVRHPDPPPTGPGGGYTRGFFVEGDTPAETEIAALTLDVVSGQTYYIRVQTESGGSEDFTIYLDVKDIYLDLQVSAIEEMHGTLIDAAEVYYNLQASGIDEGPDAWIDTVTVPLDLVASGVDVKAFAYVDAATARVQMTAITEHECIFHTEPSWIFAGVRKWSYNGLNRRWSVDGARRWAWIEGEGQPQIC